MRFAALVLALFAFVIPVAAHADSITVTQVNTNNNIQPGQTIDLQFQFTALATNTGNVSDTNFELYYFDTLFSYAFNSPLYAFNLAPGQSTTQNIVYLTAYNTAPVGTYTTNLLVYNGNTLLGSGSYTVNVTPEPSSLVLLGTGMVGMFGLARRKFARA